MSTEVKLPKYHTDPKWSDRKRHVPTDTEYLFWDKIDQCFVFYRYNPQTKRALRKSLSTTSESEAKIKVRKKLDEFEAKVAAEVALVGNKTFGYYAKRHFEDLERRRKFEGQRDGLSKSQLQNYRILLAKIYTAAPELAETKVSKITLGHLQRWTDGFKQEHSRSYFNQLHGLLKKVFELAEREGEIVRNPMALLRRSTKPVAERLIPTKQQFADILDFIANAPNYDNRYKEEVIDWLKFVAYTGFRPGAVNSLRKEDVEIKVVIENGVPREEGTIHLRQRSKTENSLGEYPLLEKAVAHVKHLLKAYPHTPKLLPLACVTQTLIHVCNKLKMPRFTPYTFRHLFATEALEAGLDFKTIGALLGHSLKDGGKLAASTYTHFRREFLHAQLAKINNVHRTSQYTEALAQAIDELPLAEREKLLAAVKPANVIEFPEQKVPTAKGAVQG